MRTLKAVSDKAMEKGYYCYRTTTGYKIRHNAKDIVYTHTVKEMVQWFTNNGVF